MNAVLSLLICFALIATPTYLLVHDPTQYNATAQVLFAVLLFAASTWFSYALSNSKAKREASSKWLPAAEGATKQLITIAHTVSRMKAKQINACKQLKPLITPERAGDCQALEHFFSIQCDEFAENLTTIKNQLDQANSQWDMFIAENCEFGECLRITQRIENLRITLAGDNQPPLSEPSPREPNQSTASNPAP